MHGCDMPDGVYEVVGAGEAWADLRDVIAESDLDERQELLQIIDNTPDENLREQRIRKLNGRTALPISETVCLCRPA